MMKALWSLHVPALNWLTAVPGLTFVLLGAGSAAATLALARMADDQQLIGETRGATSDLPSPEAERIAHR